MTTGNGATNQRLAKQMLAEARPMLARRRALLTASSALAIITDLRRTIGTP